VPKTKTKVIAECYVCAEKLSVRTVRYGIVKENPFHKEAFCPECFAANPDCHATPQEWERFEHKHLVWPVPFHGGYCPTCARYGDLVTFKTDREGAAHFKQHPLEPEAAPVTKQAIIDQATKTYVDPKPFLKANGIDPKPAPTVREPAPWICGLCGATLPKSEGQAIIAHFIGHVGDCPNA